VLDNPVTSAGCQTRFSG